MTEPSSSRQQILNRVRIGTGTAEQDAAQAASYASLPRAYTRRGQLTPEASVALMVERLREYDAEVVECTPEELPDAIAAQLAASGKLKFVAPPGIPSAWMVTAAWQVNGLEWNIDHGLSAAEIEQAEGVVTAASCGIADSGTIVLHHTTSEGRRVLTLLPDWHLCILNASQVVETLPEYFDRCLEIPKFHPSGQDLPLGTPALVTWISGPSATADIEMTRIKGVHGPRFLHVILVKDQDVAPTVN